MRHFGWSLFSLFLALFCIISLQTTSVDAYFFHRKLARTSPLFEKINSQRVEKRAIHNLSLLRLGGKLFRTEQPQVKRLMPDPIDVEYQVVERPGKASVPLLWLLIRGNQNEKDGEYQE